MSLTSLDDVFLDVLKDTLDAEKQILKALPKMAKGAESEELKAAFDEHKAVTETQVDRLEAVFKSIDKAARGKHCPGMVGRLIQSTSLRSSAPRSNSDLRRNIQRFTPPRWSWAKQFRPSSLKSIE